MKGTYTFTHPKHSGGNLEKGLRKHSYITSLFCSWLLIIGLCFFTMSSINSPSKKKLNRPVNLKLTAFLILDFQHSSQAEKM